MSGIKGMTSTKPAAPPLDSRPGDDFSTLLDGRRTWMKQGKAREAERIADLGGPEAVSAAMHSLVRRLVNVELWIEATEARILGGPLADDDELVGLWLKAVKVHESLSARLGLKRYAREVPDVAAVLHALRKEDDDARA